MKLLILALAFSGLVSWAQDTAPFADYINRAPDGDKSYASEGNFLAAQGVADTFAQLALASDHLRAEGYTLADKKENTLYILAETSSMTPGEPIEFFVTTTNSGYNYESIAVAYAVPSAVHRGLEFIGAKPGWTVNYRTLRFWPRGEHISIEVLSAGRPAMRIEDLARDERTTNTVARTDFVFVGSSMVPRPGATNETVYAADAISPQAIASNFNLLETVLDLPQQRAKSSVYGQHFYTPKGPFRPRQPVVLRLRRLPVQPEMYLTMEVQGRTLSDLVFTLKDAAGTNHIETGASFKDLLANFDRLTAAGKLPHVDLSFGPDIELATLRQLAEIFRQINAPAGIRIGPPVGNQLYFESFAPNQVFRDRTKRPSQPFELHLKGDGAEFVDITEKWTQGKLQPELSSQIHAVESPDKLKGLIEASANERETLFVYAEPTTTHAEIMAYIKPVQDLFHVLFVYTLDASEETGNESE